MTDSETEASDGGRPDSPPTTENATDGPNPGAQRPGGPGERSNPAGRSDEGSPEPSTGEGGPAEDSGSADSAESDAPSPSDAFGALGNEVRMSVLRELAAAEREGEGRRTFSELFEASGTDTTAGFAYHLRQLDGHYVREVDAGYELTYAGRKVARAIAGGTYTDSVSRDPVPVADPCPFCGTEALELRSADNYTSVACRDCERVLLTLPFPPGGHRSHDDADLPRAFDRHQRHRISLSSEGVCPECGAAVERSVERPPAGLRERLPDETGDRIRLAMTCEGCGHRVRCPVTLSILDHPAVVAFYREHDEDVRERPLWNVGAEWRETVVSTEPWCVLVSTRLDDEVLDLFLDAEGTVVATRRSTVD